MNAPPRAVVGLALALALALGCEREEPVRVYETVPVTRRDIVVSAEAAGTIEPDVTVEVKSKAAGEVLEIPVETGDRVEKGALLARIDQRLPRNAVAESQAELEVAQAALANRTSQLKRAASLFKSRSISQAAYDQAVLDEAVAKADVVRARVSIENAKIQMDDTEIRASIAGTILTKNVEVGQVISTPTRDVGEGTVLMRMADLDRVRVRALVDETDIGKIEPGQAATVVVAAYPSRHFEGRVLKVEPQAVIEQNVTTFPVLVRVESPEGMLKPGMNCEVEIHVDRREGVLALPNAALRTWRDLGSAARILGLSEDSVREGLEQDGARGAARAEPGEYFVFVERPAGPVARRVRTGLTDLDYSEVLSGVEADDAVFVLPSAGLVRSQEERRDRLERLTGGGLPGLRSRSP